MAYTEQDVAELESAIKSGVLTVRHRDGTSSTFQSLDALRKARREMLREIEAGSTATRRRRTFRLYQSGRGL